MERGWMIITVSHVIFCGLLRCVQMSTDQTKWFRSNRVGGDEFSKNISNLLENLLENYDSSQRPKAPNGVATMVTTSMLIRSMGPISELHRTYHMDCYFRQSWNDSRLRFEGSPVTQLSLSIKMLEGIWKPDTFFHNGHDSYIHTITVPNKLLRIKQTGEVFYSVRLTVKAKCPMPLHNFPFDVQSCPLVLSSFAYTKEELSFNWGSVGLDRGMAMSQFDLIGDPELQNYNKSISYKNAEFSVLQVNFTFRRHMGYFLIQVYLPCILIVVLSWVSFWINREATADRIGLGITSVLTLSTFVLDTRNDLPKVHYPTALDWFVFMCFSFVIATLLEFAGVHYFTKVGSGEIEEEEEEEESESEEDEDNFLLEFEDPPRRKKSVCAVSTQTETQRPTRCHQFWLCLVADEEYKKRITSRYSQHHINSVSTIDRVSRVLFPLVFTLLNIIYWMTYTTQKHK